MTATRPPHIRPASARSTGWLVVARQEAAELWLGAKGLSVLFTFSLVLAVLSYLAAANAGINLLDARESVGLVVSTSIGLGTLAALVISADAISGERERRTLEALLVTPLSRRDLVVGKLLSATTMWVASLLTTLPFVVVLAHGPGLVVDAITALVVAGVLIAAALTALGLAVSAVAGSNRTSLVGAVTALLLLVAPSQLPAVKAGGTLGSVLLAVDPVSAGLTFANNIVVKQQPWPGQIGYLISPLLAAIALTALAVWLSRRIELGGTP